MDLSGDAWDNRYLNNDIGWDLGEISTPLKVYIDQLENKEDETGGRGGRLLQNNCQFEQEEQLISSCPIRISPFTNNNTLIG